MDLSKAKIRSSSELMGNPFLHWSIILTRMLIREEMRRKIQMTSFTSRRKTMHR